MKKRRSKKPSNSQLGKARARRAAKPATERSTADLVQDLPKQTDVWYPASEQQGLAGDFINTLNQNSALSRENAKLHAELGEAHVKLSNANEQIASLKDQLTRYQTKDYLRRVGLENCRLRVDPKGMWVFAPNAPQVNVPVQEDSVPVVDSEGESQDAHDAHDESVSVSESSQDDSSE